jgi:hypothetical protein
MDQCGGRGPRAFMLPVREAGVECPGSAFAANRGAAGFQGFQRRGL